MARLFAKTVNCAKRDSDTESGPDDPVEPCNECEFCQEITQGRSFDVIELDAASNRGIDPIRELRENTKLAPAACSYKIYIIDEAHMLTQEAFNALLKTLEEPPPHVIFILATTEHHKIPKTIVSRCQDFDFRYMELNQIIGRLELIAAEEGIEVDDQALSLIARQSEGCLRDAENALERIISAAGKTLDAESVDQILGLGSRPLINKLVDAVLDCNLPDSVQVLASLTNQGADLTQCLHQLIAYFRNMRLLAINTDLANLIQGSQSDIQGIKGRAANISVERLSRIIKILMRTSSEIKQYGYAQIQLESSLVEINSIREGIQLGEVLKKLGEIEDRIDRPKKRFDPGSDGFIVFRQGGINEAADCPTADRTANADCRNSAAQNRCGFGYFKRRVLGRRHRGGFRIGRGKTNEPSRGLPLKSNRFGRRHWRLGERVRRCCTDLSRTPLFRGMKKGDWK